MCYNWLPCAFCEECDGTSGVQCPTTNQNNNWYKKYGDECDAGTNSYVYGPGVIDYGQQQCCATIPGRTCGVSCYDVE